MTRTEKESLKLHLGTAGVLLFLLIVVYMEVVP